MKKAIFFLFLVASQIIVGQSFTLSGKVVDSENKPLTAATIQVLETKQATITDVDGEFLIKLPKGIYTIQVSYVGFETSKKTINLSRNEEILFQLLEDLNVLEEISVRSVRVNAEAPITHSNLTRKDLEKRNLGQDIATQLKLLPNVVTNSDAGAGIGYTGFRVRGTGNQGINVTINGIPYNDAESATSFFVNLQDFTSSVENLQLQRGVGTSTNGSGAFGASLNILTDNVSEKASASISNSFGSFNTRRNNVKFSTGLLNDHFEISGRISQIKSDGYIDRASSNLKSYFLQGVYKDENTLIKFINFAGSEVTYQSWFGIDRATLALDRTFNPAGQRFDDAGNPEGFHENQVDDYKQDHFQFHWNQKINRNWSSSISLNYTYGRGFFEEYVDDWFSQNIAFDGESALSFYGLSDVTIGNQTITTSDIIRRRWLDNDFYVASANVNYKDSKLDFISGLFYSKYIGDHFGEVTWARFASDSETGQRYYFGTGEKDEFSLFAKANYKLTDKFQVYLDLQGRFINYETVGQNSDVADFIVDESYSFFNPKLGLSYRLNDGNQFYVSYARANREPNRTDFENGSPRPEKLDDFELGWRHKSNFLDLNVNGFFMDYTDQLVQTGALDNVGAPIRANSGSSYRLGLEIEADVKLSEKFHILPNIAFSKNKNRDFIFQRDAVFQNLGDTDISYSPNVVIGNTISYSPEKNINISLLTKYVGDQFLGNIESPLSKLDAFFVNDLNISYSWNTLDLVDSIEFSLLINNIFDEKYSSNGYFFTFDDDFSNPGTVTTIEGAGFYPQAGTNFLAGITLKF